MKVILVGAHGTIGRKVADLLTQSQHEVIAVGRSRGELRVDISNKASVVELFKKIGEFDALINASGEVAFAPLREITDQNWQTSFASKLLGQINLVQQGTPFISPGGSFTLVSGVLGDEQILAGTVAATVNSALEGFVRAASCELPNGIRINVVSPTLLQESVSHYGEFFKGFKTVTGEQVAMAYLRSLSGVQTGQVFKVR